MVTKYLFPIVTKVVSIYSGFNAHLYILSC